MPFGARRAKFRRPLLSNDSSLWRWLTDQVDQTKDWTDFIYRMSPENNELRKAWDEQRDAVLKWWLPLHPGTRPRAWWIFDSPGPRRRTGGTGKAMHSIYGAWAASYHLGVPVDWADDVDLKSPPRFESQAAFLRRHKLLTKEEADVISKSAYRSEPVTDIFGTEEENTND